MFFFIIFLNKYSCHLVYNYTSLYSLDWRCIRFSTASTASTITATTGLFPGRFLRNFSTFSGNSESDSPPFRSIFSSSKMCCTLMPRAVASSRSVCTVDRLEEISAILLAFISYAKLASACKKNGILLPKLFRLTLRKSF